MPEPVDPLVQQNYNWLTWQRDRWEERYLECRAALRAWRWIALLLAVAALVGWRPGTVMSVAGHVAPIAKAREVMEMDWTTREELAEAIPPYYSGWVGLQLRDALTRLRRTPLIPSRREAV